MNAVLISLARVSEFRGPSLASEVLDEIVLISLARVSEFRAKNGRWDVYTY